MKKILSLLFCAVFLLSLAACGESAPAEGTDGTGSIALSETDTKDTAKDSEKNSEKDTEKETEKDSSDPWEKYLFDTEAEHKFLATDIKNHSIVIFDLNKCKGDPTRLTNRTCVVWEWDADKDENCKIKPGTGIDAAKLRYSPYYQKDVVIACSSTGWAGVIDYQKKTVLWEYQIGGGPHSIELMPETGDIVVAGSAGNGILAYVPLSAGVTAPSDQVTSNFAHGVMWDPQNQCLWVLESSEIVCFTVDGEGTADAKLIRHEDRSVSLVRKDSGAHVISPVLGKPGIYWIAGANKLWQFNSATGEVSQDYDAALALSQKDTKGVASFPDGTVVQTAGGLGGSTTYDWSSKAIRVTLYREKENGTVSPVNKDVFFKNREFYKVFPLTKDYQ